jgi:ABC-2 type transport system ATP-binding protein
VFGFLGVNGAGKTTTIRMLLNLVRPSGGSASIFGIDCQKDSLKTRALVGYLPGELGLYPDMTGAQMLALTARLSSAPVSTNDRDRLLDRLSFAKSDLTRTFREYSTGMKRKLGVVQALQADAPLLILDEPTEGLDPLVQRSLYDLLLELRARGRTIFMSSHVLSEIERLCDRIAVVRKGELVLVSTVDDARRGTGRTVRIRFATPVDAVALPPNMHFTDRAPDLWTLAVDGEVGALLPLLGSRPVHDIEISEPSLEDVLQRFYRDQAQ